MPREHGVRLEEEDDLGEAGTSRSRESGELASEHDQGEFLPARNARSMRLLALKNPQLLPQKEDFNILVMVRSAPHADEVKQKRKRLREHKEAHGAGLAGSMPSGKG